jgi:hypothetical protein
VLKRVDEEALIRGTREDVDVDRPSYDNSKAVVEFSDGVAKFEKVSFYYLC